jgi:hypothetical protein
MALTSIVVLSCSLRSACPYHVIFLHFVMSANFLQLIVYIVLFSAVQEAETQEK